MKDNTKRCLLYMGIALLLIIVAANYPIKPQLKMKIIYQFGLDKNAEASISFDLGEGFNEKDILISKVDTESTYKEKLYEIEFEIPSEYYLAEGIKITPQDASESKIRCIEFYNNNTQIRRFDIYELTEYFEPSETFYLEPSCYVLESEVENVSMVASDKFLEEYQDFYTQVNRVRYNLYLYIFLIIAVLIVIQFNYSKMKHVEKGKNTKCEYLIIAWLVLIMVLVAIMALKSQLYAHPDENVTRMAIDYFLGGFRTPHLLSNWAAGTFSERGAARIHEATWYYFVAGKIGWIFKQIFSVLITYFRLLNVLMFAILIIIYIKMGKSNPWLIICFVFTPQLWYLFSYATSDAWDFFWSFAVVYQLAHERSMLNQYLREKKNYMSVPFFLVGFVFSIIFQAKLNYYVILLLAFLVLLFRLFALNKESRKSYLIKCILIVILSIGLANGKAILMNAPFQSSYSIEKRILMMQENEKELPPQIENTPTYSDQKLYEQNVSFLELFTERELGRYLFDSFTGGYSWMTIFGGKTYKVIMAALYLCFLVLLLWEILKEKKGKERVELLILLSLNLLTIVAVIYQCWFIDYQPQGRYILTSVLIFAYVTSRVKVIFKSNYFRLVLILLGISCTYSYVFVAMKNLIG